MISPADAPAERGNHPTDRRTPTNQSFYAGGSGTARRGRLAQSGQSEWLRTTLSRVQILQRPFVFVMVAIHGTAAGCF